MPGAVLDRDECAFDERGLLEPDGRDACRLVDLSMGCRALAGAIRSDRGAPDSGERALAPDARTGPRYAQTQRILARLERYRATAAEIVASMNDDPGASDATRSALDERALPPRMRPPRLAPIRANLSRDSEREASAKSVIGVLGLGISRGHRIRLTASGADADAAVDALVGLVESGLGEEIDD